MKVFQILILMFGLSIFTNAQESVLSGTVYDQVKARVAATEISIKESNGENYKTKTNDSGEYRINLPFGNYTVEFVQIGFKILRVTNLKVASSVKIVDATLESGRCEDCNGAIYGKRWDDYAVLSGTVYDSAGAVIEDARIVFRGAGKKEKSKITGTDGNYKIELDNGIYSIEINAVGFKTFKIENYKLTGTKTGMNFDVVLEVKSCDDPTVICLNLTANPIKTKP